MYQTRSRRWISLMLAFLLCLSVGTQVLRCVPAAAAETAAEEQPPVTADEDTADVSPAPACAETGAHVYETYTYAGEGLHSATCVLCGESAQLACVYPDPYQPDGDGTHSRTCTLCAGRTEEACVYTATVTPPTEETGGYTTFLCGVCGYTYQGDPLPAEKDRQLSRLGGDANNDGAVTAEDARSILRAAVSLEKLDTGALPYADLDADGFVLASDARLSLRIAVGLDPDAERHAYQETVEKSASCTLPGTLTFRCDYCGKSGVMEIPANGHQLKETERTEPTCTEDGSVAVQCTVCDFSKKTVLRATGHRLQETGRIDPTCTENGSVSYRCLNCSYTENTVLPASGHAWVAASPTAPAHCENCDLKETGWTQIDGSWYYFFSDGSRAEGKQRIEGLVYRFVNGVSQTGKTGSRPKVAVLGDSLVASLAIYINDSQFDFYGKVSLHVDTMATKRMQGSTRTILGELDGRDYDVVILLVGINDLTYDTARWKEMYRGVIRDVQNRSPGSDIYVHTIMPANQAKAQANGYSTVTTARINGKNAVLKTLAAEEHVGFLNATPVLGTSNGQLPYDAAGDGIHIGKQYSQIWLQWVRNEI